MPKEIIHLIAGLLIGAAISWLVATNMIGNQTQNVNTPSASMDHDMESMATDDVQALDGKTGDEFDKAFIGQMIPHHVGAIEMAKLAINNAGHQEVKDLAKDIIEAQNKEIKLMREWQSDWGY